jgi:glycosyltransferase involved in cell wall biosynthesis
MRIGIVAARLGDVDGVSFEALKWQTVLTEMGHEVVRAAGSLGERRHADDATIPQMRFDHAASAELTTAAFDRKSSPSRIRAEIDRLVGDLQPRIQSWIDSARIELLIVQNAWAIPMQVPLAVALARLARDGSMPVIGHHHDYWWERERFQTCLVPEVIEEAFPPDLPNVTHVSINSLAAAELLRQRGLASTVVPNVFDFDQPLPEGSESDARRLRKELGLASGGLLFVQPTRVVPRKGIELAIEMVARLNHPNSALLITSPAGDEGHEYLDQLLDLAARLNVDVLYQPGRFYPGLSARPESPAHELADGYIAADVITYPSLYEGFGNALIESVFFRKLILVNRYSVYDADIRPLGFRFVELSGEVTDEAVDNLRAALADPIRQAADAEHNFKLGREHFSYDRLRRDLGVILRSAV